MGVAVPFALGTVVAEDAVDPVHVDPGYGGGRGKLERHPGGVKRLLVLPEADIADKPGVAQDDPLATDDNAGLLAGPRDLRAVDLRRLRIEHHRVADTAVGRA